MAVKLYSVAIFIIASLYCFTHVYAACYYPDGNLAPNYVPCRDNTANSVCCGQGYACLSNGICQATGDELKSSVASVYTRGACTDRTWRSSSCPLFCINPRADNMSGGATLGKCDNDEFDLYWCIRVGQSQPSCDQEIGLLYFPGTPSVVTTIGVSSSTKQPSSTSTTLVSTPPPTRTPSQSSTSATESHTSETPTGAAPEESSSSEATKDSEAGSNNRASIIGGAVGGSVGAVGLAGLGAWFIYKRRKRPTPVGEGSHEEDPAMQFNEYDASPTARNEMVYEVVGSPVWTPKPPDPVELPGSTVNRYELPA